MTDDLHQFDYNTIDRRAVEQAFEDWAASELRLDKARASDWHDSERYPRARECRFGEGNAGLGYASGTIFFDNRRPNGFMKIHGEDGVHSWKYGIDGQSAAVPLPRLSQAELDRMAEEDRLEREAAAAEAARHWQEDLEAYLHDSDPITPQTKGIGADYLRNKRVEPTELLRVMRHSRRTSYRKGEPQAFPAGSLIIPLFDAITGRLTAFQWITAPSGKDNKRFRRGHSLNRIVHWIGGRPQGSDVIALAEGYATAWSFYHLTGITTGSTCDAGQLKKTAAALLRCESFTGAIIIAADDDFIKATEIDERTGEHKRNTGSNTARDVKSIDPRRVFTLKPPFDHTAILRSGEHVSDWNDFMMMYGDETARPLAEAMRDQALAFFKQNYFTR